MGRSSLLWIAASVLLFGSLPFWLPSTFGPAEDAIAVEETVVASTTARPGTPPEGTRERAPQQPAASPRVEIERRFVHADGTPAAGVRYWVSPSTDLPEPGFTTEPIAVPETARASDGQGRWTIDSTERGVVWCELPAIARVGFEIDAGTRVLRLPAIDELQVGAHGLGATEEWLVFTSPIWKPSPDAEVNYGGHVAYTRRGEGGLGRSIVVSARKIQRVGGHLAPVRVVAKLPFHVYAEASAHELETDEIVAAAPDSVLFRVTRRLPCFRVEVVDAGTRSPTRLPGKVLLSPAERPDFASDFELSDGVATVGYLDLVTGTRYRLRALLSDGEVLEEVIKVTEDQATVRLERGSGIAPVTIDLEVPAGATLLLETGDGRIRSGAPLANASFLSEAFAYELDAETLRLVGAERGWRTLWVLGADGRIGRADNTGPRTRGRWLDARELPELDLAREFDARQPKHATVYFEVSLTNADGKSNWRILDWFHLDPKKRSLGWPKWTKKATTGIPHRFRMKLADGPDELLVPRGK